MPTTRITERPHHIMYESHSSFRIKMESWLSSGGGSPFQTPFCMRGVFWRPSSSFVQSTPPKTAMLPRSPTYTQPRPKRRFQKSSLEMRPTQNRIHAELRAFLSPADADCAQSDERSGWITPRIARYRHTSRGTAG